MEKVGLSPQRIKHALSLLRRVINHGKKDQLTTGLTFQIEMPAVDNEVTEDLSVDELNRLLRVISEDKHPFAGSIM